MKKTVKIILHHKVNQNVQTDNGFSLWKIIRNFPVSFLNFLVSCSYYIGLAIISIPKLPRFAVNYFNKQTTLINLKPNYKKVLSFALLVAIAATPIFLLQVASEGQKVGGRILGLSTTVLKDVNSAQDALKQQDFAQAQSNFANILTNLNSAQSELNQSSLVLQSIVKLAPSSYNTSNALEAAKLLTECAKIGSGLLGQVNNFGFSPEGLTMNNNQDPKTSLLNIKNDIELIDSKFEKANQLLAPLDSTSLPANIQSPLKDTQSLVAQFSTQMDSLKNATNLLTDLLLGSKKFLVLLQNNNELRATGGFIGTIAQGQLTDASIKNLDIRSVYDLDGQMLAWIVPPYPMRAVNNRLFLRDANWMASFPESAQRLSALYEKEGGETPDLVVAMTPDIFIDLLNKTGPISLPKYKVVVSSSNFIEQIQTTTSVAYDKGLNQPKQLLADLYPILLQKIGSDRNGILGILELMQNELTTKNLLIYSRDPETQKLISDFRWSGQVSDSNKDYLQINSSNLGGTKTDRSLKRVAHIETTIQGDGSILNQVIYTITNPLPNNTGLLNRSFVRFFVPEGSKVLAADGFSNIEMPQLPTQQKYVNDTVVEEWNKNLQFDSNHNVYIGKESGKNIIANWLEVQGGETKTVTITYQLPLKIHGLDTYSLLWEKQSGMMPFEASQDINYANKALLWDNLGNQSRQVNKPDSTTATWAVRALDRDQFIGLVLK